MPTSGYFGNEFHAACEFAKQEIDVALSQMAPLKAPGLDGMLTIFLSIIGIILGGGGVGGIFLKLFYQS